jgi:YVTN family beta-propeller protein
MHSRTDGLILFLGAMVSTVGCGDSGEGGNVTPPPPPPAAVLKRASKSSNIAITEDDRFVAMTNPQDGSISIFRTGDNGLAARVHVGGEPSSIVIGPDNATAYVANRADATVVKVSGIDTAAPQVSPPVAVGAEPTGVALSPSGAKLYVVEHAEGSVAVIDTATMKVASVLKGSLQHPFAITVTNNGDANDNDELLVITELFGEGSPAGADPTRLDQALHGRVRLYDVANLTGQGSIVFSPFNTGLVPDATPAGTAPVFTQPNQLSSITLRRDAGAPGDRGKMRIYVTSVSPSPQPPLRFNTEMFPVVYVGELGGNTEVAPGAGGTVNLAAKLFASAPNPNDYKGKLFLSDIVDMAFVADASGTGETGTAYIVARGADAVQRVVFDGSGVSLGTSARLQIDMIGSGADKGNVYAGCKGPIGIVLASDASKAYVNCWVSHRLGVVNLGLDQTLATTVESFPQPASAAGQQVDRGRRFFFTGRGRWSGNGRADTVSSGTVTALNPPSENDLGIVNCGSCHPVPGLSDNVTWVFDTGPRQTVELAGSFAKGRLSPGKQRIFNFTAIFEELHDFERNTRGVAGGMGAITTAAAPSDCRDLTKESRKLLVQPGTANKNAGGLDTPVRDIMNDPAQVGCVTDWDDIEAWVQTVRAPKGLQRLDAAQVAAGREVFGPGTAANVANCAACHSGAGWTLSRRFWTPSNHNNIEAGGLTSTAFSIPTSTSSGVSAFDPSWNFHAKQIEPEVFPGRTPVAPTQVACVTRIVGTFGIGGDASLELNAAGTPAQGFGGYNIPGLYGLSLGAPYLHHGQAHTLDELLDPSGPWAVHLKAGNPNFQATPDRISALEAFLLSIDGDTPELETPVGFDACLPSFANP